VQNKQHINTNLGLESTIKVAFENIIALMKSV